ncbi:MAG TPA: hypothetical protein PKG54_00870 [Phycisphaerae bacterium]|jgi:hypothetical protein|nr:hypothetical protein [Phycisphaerae bacterium]HOB73051.1 hypothetical protein [Phycisphaerae bacterium]HOJ54068.1 hypothetical protein [Phycisphaerae bacterium]HOL26479.1 hypothetical protein [Phycisphaerae bacterium]HPP20458.1 hypothetical protein [Phycisphaerae bacterium]
MIQLQCENCGKYVKAPQEAAGKQAKCPGCGHNIYIPHPDEVEELPLAPEDTEELRREAALQEERRRLDRILAREERVPAEGANPTRSSGLREPAGGAGTRIPASVPSGSGQMVEDAVIEYLGAMRDADFDRAEQVLDILRRNRAEARQIVDRLAVDQIPPPSMTRVPAPVYQGFLRNLRAQL